MAKKREFDLGERFGEAKTGVLWAFTRIPESRVDGTGLHAGERSVRLEMPKGAAGKEPGDDFAVHFAKQEIVVTAATAVGTIGGLLRAAQAIRAGQEKDFTQKLQFKTRNYKHEIRFEDAGGHGKGGQHKARPIGSYSQMLLDSFFQNLVERHFNGIVLYAGYHPFEHFLDYEGVEHYTDRPKAERAANYHGLLKFLNTAKQYGLRTFLHHYATHFTQALANHLKLGIDESGTRLAAFEHPEVYEYNRYIYRRSFETLPALDGLYINFESSGNAVPYMQQTLLKVASSMKKMPALFFRLWGVSDVSGMTKLLRSYKGPKALIHKGHDTADFYYSPVADGRVRIWKEALPEVEFLFSVGPCHNCGTNISQRLWCDPTYIHALLKDFQAKGADSISFQSIAELTLPHLTDADIFSEHERSHAKFNQGHLAAVVDYVRGESPTPKEWSVRYAEWFGLSGAEGLKAGAAIQTAILESSQIVLKQYRQFWHGSSQEGYTYPGLFSYYQEPFFYYPQSFLNQLGEMKHWVHWQSWAIRTKPEQVVPDDTEAVIDYVNPAVKKHPANNPQVLCDEIQGHIAATRKAFQAYVKAAGTKADPEFAAQVERNLINGERIFREIQIAMELYACYFASSKAAFFKHLKQARAKMLETAKVLGDKSRETDRFQATGQGGRFDPAGDAAQLEKIIACEKENVPFEALAAYLKSHERYNEIRRLSRACLSVRGALAERNRGLLLEALAACEKALAPLTAADYGLYRDNVLCWRDYLRAELDWLTPPTMACPPDEALHRDAGFRTMVHDQNYRWGEFCWEDFDSFFRRRNFFREDLCDCKATYTDAGLKLYLREHNIRWRERKEMWDKNRGTMNQTGFMRIYIDPKNTGRRVLSYRVFFEGVGGDVSSFEERADGLVESTPTAVMRDVETKFWHNDSEWAVQATIPWSQLGGKPKPGDLWRLNLLTNAPVKKNHHVSFCQGYEFFHDVARLGWLKFL
ncbi:MAG: hypothetical protein ACREJ2_14535 [Planctomycetota bacterium]